MCLLLSPFSKWSYFYSRMQSTFLSFDQTYLPAIKLTVSYFFDSKHSKPFFIIKTFVDIIAHGIICLTQLEENRAVLPTTENCSFSTEMRWRYIHHCSMSRLRVISKCTDWAVSHVLFRCVSCCAFPAKYFTYPTCKNRFCTWARR